MVGEKAKELIAQIHEALTMTYEYFFPPPEEGAEGEDGAPVEVKRTPEQIMKFVIQGTRGRKITDIININSGKPAIEEAAGAAAMFMKKGLNRKANFGPTPGRNTTAREGGGVRAPCHNRGYRGGGGLFSAHCGSKLR